MTTAGGTNKKGTETRSAEFGEELSWGPKNIQCSISSALGNMEILLQLP